MQAITGSHVDLYSQRILKKELDADEVDQGKFLGGIVVNEQVKVAVRCCLIAGR